MKENIDEFEHVVGEGGVHNCLESHRWTNPETSTQETKIILSASPSITRSRRNTWARNRDESCEEEKRNSLETIGQRVYKTM